MTASNAADPAPTAAPAAPWPVPFLFGGRVCLDFVNTVNSRSRPATRDYLPDWTALLGWCRQTALFEAAVLDRLDRLAAASAAETGAVHERALALREALHRLFRAVMGGVAMPRADLGLVDALAREARTRQALVPAGAGFARPGFVWPGFVWQWEAGRLDLAAPLHAVALSAADLLTGGDLRRVKECPAPDGCGWLFFDETKNGSRRWCSMDHCGGAAKARRYAARHGARAREEAT